MGPNERVVRIELTYPTWKEGIISHYTIPAKRGLGFTRLRDSSQTLLELLGVFQLLGDLMHIVTYVLT